jgi:uncharacterized protein
MRIAVIGGGASGMATAYLLDKQGHQVTVFERQPILGGHIRTLNKNVQPNRSNCQVVVEGGVLEFPTAFTDFITLMQELEVELEPVRVGSGLYFKDGRSLLSAAAIDKNFTGLHRLLEHLRIDTLYARSVPLWLKSQLTSERELLDRSLSDYLSRHCDRNTWLKLLVMYSYSLPLESLDDFPAALAIPMLRAYLAVEWVRVKGGVYTYIEKILARFRGKIVVGVEIDRIVRTADNVTIVFPTGDREFDTVVFATPPDRVLALLADPTDAEARRFGSWKANYAKTIVHTDDRIYARYGVQQPSEFDFFETNQHWGYNGYLNQLCSVAAPPHYALSFQLEELIDRETIVHIQEHHTPLYTTASFHDRDEIVLTNGADRTYHVGAYLGDGLHGGAIASAFEVARLVGTNMPVSVLPAPADFTRNTDPIQTW